MPATILKSSVSREPVQAFGPMPSYLRTRKYFQRRFLIPTEHGTWIWWLGPFVLGIAAARQWSSDLATLFLAMLAVFLLRQPLSIFVKTLSGRRAPADRPPALVWIGVYALIAFGSFTMLLSAGFGRLIWLLLPGIPVFTWHLLLVSRRAERGKPGIEIVGAGVLALAAPASYWVAGGPSTSLPWALWAIAWLQSAASIVLVYQRLKERGLNLSGGLSVRVRRASRSFAYHGFNLVIVLLVWWYLELPWTVVLASVLMLLDALDTLRSPALGWKPTRIGMRQLTASSLFTILVVIGFLTNFES
jgi:hypothetical protein